jgi:hypothetical protein
VPRQRRIAAIEVMDVAQDAERAARGKWALEAIERSVTLHCGVVHGVVRND